MGVLVALVAALVTALVALGEGVNSWITAGGGPSDCLLVLLDRRTLAGVCLAGLLALAGRLPLLEEAFVFFRPPEPDDGLVGRLGEARFFAFVRAIVVVVVVVVVVLVVVDVVVG